MKKISALFFLFAFFYLHTTAQENRKEYKKISRMIPMRDGVKLFTVILMPVNDPTPEPFLI